MGQPGKIAFPVILVLGAITGYITYTFFTAATPDEARIDSPYYQPLSPTSGGNEQGGAGGAAPQQQGGGGGGAAQQEGGAAPQQQGGGAAQQEGGAAPQQQGGGGGETTTDGGGGGTTAAPAAPSGGGAGGGAVTLNILEGSSIQGSPDYDPDELTVSAGAEVTVVNQDTVLHTVTSGTGTSDPQSAQMFDSSFIGPGQSATLSLAQVAAGQYDYYCQVHPYMTGKLVVQ
jgi:plastocyanin